MKLSKGAWGRGLRLFMLNKASAPLHKESEATNSKSGFGFTNTFLNNDIWQPVFIKTSNSKVAELFNEGITGVFEPMTNDTVESVPEYIDPAVGVFITNDSNTKAGGLEHL